MGSSFLLTGPEARHAGTVKRMAPGELMDVVDGLGHRLTGRVETTGSSAVSLTVLSVGFEPRHSGRLVLVQGLAKGDRSELAIEAATELGVDGVLPWQADRSIARWRHDKTVKGRQKWEATVRGAAKQSRRAWIPDVLEPRNSKELVGWLEAADLAVVLHEEAQWPLSRCFTEAPAAAHSGVIAVVVGPEGGISPQEIAAFESAGAVTATLGANVLRASTAGPAALALLNHLLGRW